MALNTILSPADQDTGPEGQATTGRIILSDDGSNNNNRRPGAALTAATQSAETSPDVAYFLAIPWCRAQLLPSEGRPAGSAAAREVRVVLPAARRTALRHGPAASDRWRPDYLSSRTAPGNVISTTLNSLDTIAALLVFFEEPTPSPTHSVAYRAPIVEVKALLSLGPGLSGHIGVMHGGLVATVLDEVLGLLMPLNRRRALHNQRHNEASAAAEKQQQQHDVYWGPPSGQPISPPEEAARASASVHHGLVTAYLNTTYVRPVRTCTTILATSRFVRIEGSRKFYVEGSIWDENAQLLAKAEALFVALREKL